MDPKIFPNGNQVPALINEVVHETGLETMEPGETTWTVPWTLEVDEFGSISINAGDNVRGQSPGGTAKMKVISDFDGIFIDATALSREDVERYFSHQPGRTIIGGGNSEAKKLVSGVIYPYLKETDGLDPRAVKEFNDQQRAVRQQFGEYFKETYKLDYSFAEDEYTGYRQIGGLGDLATSERPRRAPTPPSSRQSRRWRRER